MNFLFTIFSLVSSLSLPSSKSTSAFVSPLASYSTEWNDKKYNACNTASDVSYMNGEEKEIIYILNLIRVNPRLFAQTVLKQYPSSSGKDYLLKNKYYYQSLVNTLLSLQPKGMLYPNEDCYKSARCHAFSSGISGYMGHQRKTRECNEKKHYYGECCDYGNSAPLDIVLSLLIDEGVPSLGHRNLCLNVYTQIGVSIQPHKKYGTNTVVDFYY